jgi:endonuclease/exonuclease/phosphatase family metal-dependent hydrolase
MAMQKTKLRNRISLILALNLVTIFLTAAPGCAQAQTAGGACRDIFALTPPVATRPLGQIPVLRLMTYNVENLFLHVGKFLRVEGNRFVNKKGPTDKPEDELRGVAKAITDSNPDVIVMQEIEGLEALEIFTQRFLDDRYRPVLLHGNDERGIEIGFLVKKDLPLNIVAESHRDITWKDPTDNDAEAPVFSRDLPVLLIYPGDQAVGPQTKPMFILAGNHSKSKRDRPGDPESNILRAAQFRATRGIIDTYLQRFGADLPIFLAGDFNTDVRVARDVQPIADRLEDVFDLTHAADADRVTHTFFPNGRPAVRSQLDAVMVSPSLATSIIKASVYRYKDENGVARPIPSSIGERNMNPSDHFPVVVDISTRLIFSQAKAAEAQSLMPKASGQ